VKEMGPWNGRGAEGGAAEKPVRVKRASAAGREGTRRSHSHTQSRPSDNPFQHQVTTRCGLRG